jgi:hypothetical protein
VKRRPAAGDEGRGGLATLGKHEAAGPPAGCEGKRCAAGGDLGRAGGSPVALGK